MRKFNTHVADFVHIFSLHIGILLIQQLYENGHIIQTRCKLLVIVVDAQTFCLGKNDHTTDFRDFSM